MLNHSAMAIDWAGRRRRYTSLTSVTAFVVVAALLVDLAGTIAPQLSIEAKTVRVKAGDTALLTCDVDYLGSHEVTWHRGQNVILTLGEKLIFRDPRMSVGRASMRTWELRIQKVGRGDAGDYFCAINSAKLPNDTVTLIVEEPARIVNAPQPVVTVDEFETFKLICNASGYPRPRVEWFRLNDQEEMKISENFGEILLFINVTRDCFGRYRCRASNGVGNPEHRDTEVTVIARPVVYVDPENAGRERGTKVSINCSISGNPISWAGWMFRGKMLTNGGQLPALPPLRQSAVSVPSLRPGEPVPQSASTRHRIEWLGPSSAYRAVLRLTIDPIVDKSDFGSYTCEATDGRSYTAKASFYLKETFPAGSVGDSAETTQTWFPSIVIDSGLPTRDDYAVAPSPTRPGMEQPKPPKIIDEGMPSQPAEQQPGIFSNNGAPEKTEPDKIKGERPAAADNQKGSAPGALGAGQWALTASLLAIAAVFHSWLTSPDTSPAPKQQHPCPSPVTAPRTRHFAAGAPQLSRHQRRKSIGQCCV